MKFRTIIERLSRGKVLKRSFRVKGIKAPIYISPDAQLKYLKPGSRAFDADLVTIAETFLKEDSVVWDVGANVGVFTFAAATVAKKGCVLSVEADVWLAGILRRTRELSDYRDKDIRVLPCAVSGEEGVAEFRVAMRGRAANSLASVAGRHSQGGTRSLHYVPTIRLDTLLRSVPAPDFVKIDIEGAEQLAVTGAKELIETIRPVFYMELGAESGAVLETFSKAGYKALQSGGLEVERGVFANAFLIPGERKDAIAQVGALD